MLEKSIR